MFCWFLLSFNLSNCANESSETLHNGALPAHQGIKCNALFDSHNESTKEASPLHPTDMDPNSDVKKNASIQPRPSPSPRFHRLKPTSIRKQRTLEDGHFHERKPLMSRTNYLDDSNITLSSFRSSSTNNCASQYVESKGVTNRVTARQLVSEGSP